MSQSTGTLITLELQYLNTGQDITGDPFANLDATTVRAWDDTFLQAAVQRDDDADCWRITESDAMMPAGAEVETFGSPEEALDYLAHHGGFAYQITATTPPPSQRKPATASRCPSCNDRHEDDIDVRLCQDAADYAAYVAELSDDERDADRQAELANERAIEWKHHWATL